MNVAVLCEFSGIVREAFRARGHHAVSYDLLPSEQPGPHVQGDVREADLSWAELVIAHPPCTYLCASGLHWNKRRPEREALTLEALTFIRWIFALPVRRIALENPVGRISTAIRKPNQIIQPYQFGHPESKATCLWLKNLPLLQPTKILVPGPAWIPCSDCDEFWCAIHNKHVADCPCPPIEAWVRRKIDPYTTGTRWQNQTPSGQNKLGPSSDRWAERSKTYQGIAAAMADQWGRLEHPCKT